MEASNPPTEETSAGRIGPVGRTEKIMNEIESKPNERLKDYLPKRHFNFPEDIGATDGDFLTAQLRVINELEILTYAGVPLKIAVHALPMSEQAETAAAETLHEIDLALHR
jgi:hypothetical protein